MRAPVVLIDMPAHGAPDVPAILSEILSSFRVVDPVHPQARVPVSGTHVRVALGVRGDEIRKGARFVIGEIANHGADDVELLSDAWPTPAPLYTRLYFRSDTDKVCVEMEKTPPPPPAASSAT